jgi:hypothetical protein
VQLPFFLIYVFTVKREKKEIKKNYCVYFTGVFVNRPKKKKKKKKKETTKRRKKT